MHTRILTGLTATLLLLALAACGTAPQPVQTTEPQSAAVATSERRPAEGDIALPEQTTAAQSVPETANDMPERTTAQTTTAAAPADDFGPLFQKYVRDLVADGDYTVSVRQSGISMVTTVSGKNSALESDMAGVLTIRLINRDGSYYMLMPGKKKYAEMTAEDYARQADSLESTALDLSGVHYQSSGAETVGGTTYRTETYNEDGRGSVTYYFTDAGLQRTRVVKDGKTTDVESFTVRDDADASLFEIPSDYVKVSDPSQLLT